MKRVVKSLQVIPRDNDREISISVEESRLAVAEVFFSGFFPRAGLFCPVCVCECEHNARRWQTLARSEISDRNSRCRVSALKIGLALMSWRLVTSLRQPPKVIIGFGEYFIMGTCLS